jgi:hypothetical protein
LVIAVTAVQPDGRHSRSRACAVDQMRVLDVLAKDVGIIGQKR